MCAAPSPRSPLQIVDPPAWPGAPGLLRVRVRARAREPASKPESQAAKMAQPHGRMIGHRLAHACRLAQRRPTPGELESRTLKGPDWKFSESPPASDSGPLAPRPLACRAPGPGPRASISTYRPGPGCACTPRRPGRSPASASPAHPGPGRRAGVRVQPEAGPVRLGVHVLSG
jgi:hypothetical protein